MGNLSEAGNELHVNRPCACVWLLRRTSARQPHASFFLRDTIFIASQSVHKIILTTERSKYQTLATMAAFSQAQILSSEPGFSFSQAPTTSSEPRQDSFYPCVIHSQAHARSILIRTTATPTTAAAPSESPAPTSPSSPATRAAQAATTSTPATRPNSSASAAKDPTMKAPKSCFQ